MTGSGDDAALVRRALCGDRFAFDQLARRYRDTAVGVAFNFVGNLHTAEDVAQDALLTAYVRLRQIKDPDAFGAWFLSIVRTTALTDIRRGRRRNGVLPMERVAPAELEALGVTRSQEGGARPDLAQAVESLPESLRKAVLLYYGGDLSYTEIAEELDLPTTTVKGRLHLARKQLRRMVGIESVSKGDTAMIYDFGYHDPTGKFAFMLYDHEAQSVTGLIMNRDGSTVATIPEARFPQFLRFSRDGKRVSFHGKGKHAECAISVCDVESGEVTIVHDEPDGSAAFPSLLPDGDRLIGTIHYLTHPEPAERHMRLRMVELATGDTQPVLVEEVTDEEYNDTFPITSPDGTQVVFIRGGRIGDEEWRTVIGVADLATLPAAPRFRTREPGVSHVLLEDCWSPDSSHLVVVELADDVWHVLVLDAATTEPVWKREVGFVRGAAFSRDGKYVCVVGSTELTWIRLDGSEDDVGISLESIVDPSRADYAVLSVYDGAQLRTVADPPGAVFMGWNQRLYAWQAGANGLSVVYDPERA